MAALAAAPEIPGFHALSPLGAGPSSALYSAQSERLGRWVALAVYSSSMPKSPPREVLERFQRAFEQTRRLGAHPHAVTLLDWGVSPDGRPYVVTEFYEHGTFETRVAGLQPLPIDKTLRIGIAVAGALETAHRAQIVHGGVHPARILADADDEPSLADTSLVQLVDPSGNSALLQTSNVHAPPEVLEGEALSPATDVFGLASTLHTLLTAQPPYQTDHPGDTPAMLLLRILRHEAARLDRPDAPPLLVHTLRQALHPDPAQRPASVLAFAQALQKVQTEIGAATTQPVLLDLGASLRSGPEPPPAPGIPGPGAPGAPARQPAPPPSPPAAQAPPSALPGEGLGGSPTWPPSRKNTAGPAPAPAPRDLPATPPLGPVLPPRAHTGAPAGSPTHRPESAAPTAPVQPSPGEPPQVEPGPPTAQPSRAFVPYPLPEPQDDPWFGPPAPPTEEGPGAVAGDSRNDLDAPDLAAPVSPEQATTPAPSGERQKAPVVARGPKALPIIVLGAIVAVLMAGALWMVLSGSDPSDASTTDQDQDQADETD